MPVIFATSFLHIAVYAEAAVILLLLGFIGFVWHEATLLMWDCEQAKAERDEARKTLHTLRRMSEIRVETVTRLRGFGR